MKSIRSSIVKANLTLLTIGKKGFDYFRKQKMKMLPEQNLLLNDLSFENVSVVVEAGNE